MMTCWHWQRVHWRLTLLLPTAQAQERSPMRSCCRRCRIHWSSLSPVTATTQQPTGTRPAATPNPARAASPSGNRREGGKGGGQPPSRLNDRCDGWDGALQRGAPHSTRRCGSRWRGRRRRGRARRQAKTAQGTAEAVESSLLPLHDRNCQEFKARQHRASQQSHVVPNVKFDYSLDLKTGCSQSVVMHAYT